jgi:hypothetical protein
MKKLIRSVAVNLCVEFMGRLEFNSKAMDGDTNDTPYFTLSI